MKNTVLLICVLFLGTTLSSAQEQEHSEHHSEEHKHAFGLVLSHTTIIRNGINEGESGRISVPSWGLAYTYKLSEKWGVGLQADIIIEDFTVEDDNEVVLERELPVATVLVGSYEVLPHFNLVVGAGMEWEKTENFGVFRIGAEYLFPLPKFNMEVAAITAYDVLFEGYDTITLGLGLTKLF